MESSSRASDYDLRIAEARERVAELDRVDGYRDRTIGCILQAAKCGVREPTNDASYDAIAMLEDLLASRLIDNTELLLPLVQ